MADSPLRFLRELLDPYEPLLDRLFLFGTVYGTWNVFKCCYYVLSGFRRYILRIGASPVTVAKLGEWAVVNGATTSLGTAFALDLAERNFKIILIGNSDTKLQNTAKEIEDVFGTEVFGILADFTQGLRVFEDIKELLTGLEVGLLVNNVAVRYDYPKWFEELSTQRMLHLLNIDVIGASMMTHTLLPQMLKREKGMIINICSSIATAPPTPLMTVYQSAMSYIHTFSQALHYECVGRGVIVQALLPSFVQENTERTSILAPPPHVYARHALNQIGFSSSSSGHWVHALLGWVLQFVPDSVWVWWTRGVNINLRSKGIDEKLVRRTALLNILKHSKDISFEETVTRKRSQSQLAPTLTQESPTIDRRRSHSFQSGNILISKH
ncbi:inactive hydroxysteroid dehydrogenase-like protein 1 [Dysidea avara]|uniref:inactive hydroxysteroid dehydrogenase-like protein 1 n=1 Tax=Dysidea avara TaxID=196820 RepID=UPI00331D7656